ncbi:MAG: cysteine desulfurase family protein [Rhodothermales bacterium]|nr:cysteine desulfurase family protein [Rhodothermales bacterium]
MTFPIYLDYNATTPVDPRVLERMLPFFTRHYGNASSKGHAFGWAAAEGVKQAREEVAAAMGADPSEIVFTGGATESINLAIKGIAAAYRSKGRHIVTVQTEHSAVLEACKALEQDGWSITRLSVGADGLVRLEDIEAAITEETVLVSVMWANNETGVLQPITAIGEVVHRRGALFLTDATQAFGKIPISVDVVDVMACTAHKLYGPKGVGALYIRRRQPRVRVVPQIDGGGQEDGLRAGTLNTPGIVGFGSAAAVAMAGMEAEAARLGALRDVLESRLVEVLPGVRVNGAGAPRLAHVSNLTFPGVRSANLVAELRDLALSTGSACSSGTGNPSHVLKAMGLSDEAAYATLRISLGRFTTPEEVEHAASRMISVVSRLQKPSHVTI